MANATSPISRRQALGGLAAAAAAAILPGTMARMAAAATGRPVIFISPHPDDDALAMGVAIARHVAAGRDVHLLALTRGEATKVRGQLNGTTDAPWWGTRHLPAVEGYSPLDPAAVGRARLAEVTASAGTMGVVHLHEGGLPDGYAGTDRLHIPQAAIDRAKQAVVELAASLPDTGLWATSYRVDNHPDHLAAGMAVRQLGREQPQRFWDRRYVVLPFYWGDTRLSQVHLLGYMRPASTLERARAVNACRSYGAWQPRSGGFAVGAHSQWRWLARIQADPKCLIHRD